MLKEVYVIRDGVNVYHYNKDNEHDETHYVLSSGFLSAIQSFTKETRDSPIDFFASRDEFFIFDQSPSGLEVISIFSNSMEHSVGRAVMDQILEEVEYSVLLDLGDGEIPSPREAKKLSQRFSDIASSLISIDFQVEAAQVIFADMAELSLLVLYDYSRDEVFFSSSEPEDLYSEDLLRGLRSIHRYLMKLVKSLELGEEYKLLKITYEDYIVVISKYRTKQTISVANNVSDPDEILAIPFRLMSLPDYEKYMDRFHFLPVSDRWKVNTNQKLHTVSGGPLGSNQKDDLMAMLRATERLLQTVKISNYGTIDLYVDDDGPRRVSISRNFTLQQLLIESYE